MKKPRLDAFDPKHTERMAQSFANLPPILPKPQPKDPKPAAVKPAPTPPPSPLKPASPLKQPREPKLPNGVAETEVLDIRQTGSQQRSIRITLAEKRALEDLCTRLDREFGIETDITHLLRGGALLILFLIEQRVPTADVAVVLRLLQQGTL